MSLAHILAILELLKDLLDSGELLLHLLHLQALATPSGVLDELLMRLLNELDVLDTELLADDVEIADGINITLNVDDLSIVEASHNLEDGVDGSDVRQEGVAKPSSGRGTTGQTSDVIHSQVGGNHGLGLVMLYKPVEAVVRHNDTSLFRVDGGIGKILHLSEREAAKFSCN